MSIQRLAALAAILLAAATVVAAVIALIVNFPRGLFVLLLAVLALAAGWQGVLHRGMVRVIGIAIAVVALAAVLVLLLSRDVVDTIVIVAAGLGAIAAARAAFTSHADLTAVDPPKHPVLFYNPKSGGGKAERFHLADEAAKRGIEAVELTWDTPLETLVDDALARGADALAAAGGDGTQAIVASAAARAGIPYACIPAGTRNHFALDLGVDREDVIGALDAFTTGGERLVDLAEVNGRVFVNNVSLGVYAQAVQHSGYRDAKLRTLLDTIPETARTDCRGAGAALARPRRVRARQRDGTAGLQQSVSPGHGDRVGHAPSSRQRAAGGRGARAQWPDATRSAAQVVAAVDRGGQQRRCCSRDRR